SCISAPTAMTWRRGCASCWATPAGSACATSRATRPTRRHSAPSNSSTACRPGSIRSWPAPILPDGEPGLSNTGLASLVRRARYRFGLGADGPPRTPEALRALGYRLRRRSMARSQRDAAHHRVFDLFPSETVEVPEGHYPNYFGVLSPAHYGLKAAPG